MHAHIRMPDCTHAWSCYAVPSTAVAAAAVASSWSTDPIAEAAMALHFELTMRFTANLCVIVQAMGVVFAGDNQVCVRSRALGVQGARVRVVRCVVFTLCA
jgi:hypothetical protein